MQTLLQAAALVPASIPSPDWSGIDIPLPWGTLRIHAYALCILAGIVLGPADRREPQANHDAGQDA